jgi:major vault protein
MADATNRERDLVLAPNEFAYIADQTKGHIIVYVGPCKTSLANTDQPVTFNGESKRFERCNLEHAISTFSTAPEGWYLVLKNPAKDGNQPKSFGPNNLSELSIGRKVNIPGPVWFANWPGQMVRVVKGHHLKTNQYLLVRVYDEESAKVNWKKAVIKPQTQVVSEGTEAGGPEVPGNSDVKLDQDVPDLTMGKLLVIKGTQVSFYIPPTGIEVVRDENEQYVREAVTLERLEYCILLDEDGNKRFIQGPAVVFPKPTERFVERHGTRKFKAIELNEISGIYVKVIAPYTEAPVSTRSGKNCSSPARTR